MLLAHRVACLDHLARGRFYFGVGSGGLPTDFEMFHINGAEGEQRFRTREALEIILKTWTSDEPFDYQGRFWRATKPEPRTAGTLGFHMKPFQQPHPPIGVAGLTKGSETLILAGEMGLIPMSVHLATDVVLNHWETVEYSLDGVTFFGEPDGRQSERVKQIVDLFVQAGLKAAVADDIDSVEWTKQAFQNPFAPLSAITRLPVHRVWPNPQLAALSVHMFREVAAVAQARGVALSKHLAWSLFNIATWRDASFDEAVRMIVEVGERITASGRTHIIPSMLQDVLAGKQTEIEETVGYVMREGQRLGVPVPYTEFAYRTVKAIEETYDGRVS